MSERLRPLTQGRFLNVAVFRNAALPVRGWWLPEVAEGLGKFMWGGAEAEMLVPPLPGGTALVLDFVPYRGPAPLDVVINGTVALDRAGGLRRAPRTALDPRLFSTEHANRVVFRRAEGYVPGVSDSGVSRSNSGASRSWRRLHPPATLRLPRPRPRRTPTLDL